jgi:hypothetical protein
MATTRDQILESLKDLPADATLDDAIERLVLLAKIDAGLAELDAGLKAFRTTRLSGC